MVLSGIELGASSHPASGPAAERPYVRRRGQSMAHFTMQFASDIVRDGLGLELLDKRDNVVAEVFRCDRDHTLSVSLFDRSVPTEELDRLLSRASEALGPFEDGTPLSAATLIGPEPDIGWRNRLLSVFCPSKG